VEEIFCWFIVGEYGNWTLTAAASEKRYQHAGGALRQ